MKLNTRQTLLATAVSLTLSPAMAGIVDNTNNNPGTFGDCTNTVAPLLGDLVTCVGAWNLGNVDVKVIRLLDGTVLGTVDGDGNYPQMILGDSFVSEIKNGNGTVMGKLTGKDWPVGEPTGIKAVNGDIPKNKDEDGSPINCLINTGYIEPDTLDLSVTSTPKPVVCTSGFQTHKRFKVAMQPAVVDADGGEGNPIDLVFNSTDDGDGKIGADNRYQVFSKINNYTDMRLSGFKVQVGTTDANGDFVPASTSANGQLFITVGRGEEVPDADTTDNGVDDLFDLEDMANFSAGLFGKADGNHHLFDGFFAVSRAHFETVGQACASGAACSDVTVDITIATHTSDVEASDTIDVAGLSQEYTSLFGDWLPSKWAPEGIFYDHDSNPLTDPQLVAWWNGTTWLKGQADAFAEATPEELAAWATNPLYEKDVIEDLLNVGVNYIVNVGDIHPDVDATDLGSGTFTVRIIPVVAADQTAPAWADSPAPSLDTYVPPAPVAPTTPVATDDDGDGGCVQNPNAPFNPTMPLLTLAAMGGLFWRLRRKRMN